jgi:hypothetical protein
MERKRGKVAVCLTVTPPLEDSYQDERRDLLSAKRKTTAYDDITQETSQEETPYVETETLEEKTVVISVKRRGRERRSKIYLAWPCLDD